MRRKRRTPRKPRFHAVLDRASSIRSVIDGSNDPKYGLEVFKRDDVGGYGVRACVTIPRGHAITVYRGDLISYEEALVREPQYDVKASYMFFFEHSGKSMCVDATPSKHISRYINHDRKRPNLFVRKMIEPRQGRPCLVMFSLCDIDVGEELLYDYGDRRPEVMKTHVWLSREKYSSVRIIKRKRNR